MTIEEKREKIIELLESKNFTDGIDASTEENLFEYGIIRRKSDGLTILALMYDNTTFIYDSTWIDSNDIREAIEEQKEGFYSYVGQSKEKYKEIFENTVRKNGNLALFIHDISNYHNLLTEQLTYDMNENDLIELLTNIE